MAASWPRFLERGPAVTGVDVDAFEKRFGVTLPEEYRRFLMEVNGGRTAKESREFDDGIVNTVLSLNADEEHNYNDLVTSNERVREDLGTNEVIVVAYDDGGARILLAVGGAHRGEVWVQYPDTRPGQSNPRVLWHDRRDFKKLADSFEQFLASLKPLSP